MNLSQEIRKFKEWASSLPETKFGEWEIEYPAWEEFSEAFEKFIQNSDFRTWSNQEKNDIVYCIARDNESEGFAELVAENEERLLSLAEYALNSEENDAKWQLANLLGNLKKEKDRAEKLLLIFITDQNEYVQRRSLSALANIGSKETERLCEQAWQTESEYKKIGSLWALYKIKSPKLSDYLLKAQKEDGKYLAENIKKIQEKG